MNKRYYFLVALNSFLYYNNLRIIFGITAIEELKLLRKQNSFDFLNNLTNNEYHFKSLQFSKDSKYLYSVLKYTI